MTAPLVYVFFVFFAYTLKYGGMFTVYGIYLHSLSDSSAHYKLTARNKGLLVRKSNVLPCFNSRKGWKKSHHAYYRVKDNISLFK